MLNYHAQDEYRKKWEVRGWKQETASLELPRKRKTNDQHVWQATLPQDAPRWNSASRRPKVEEWELDSTGYLVVGPEPPRLDLISVWRGAK